MPQVRTAGAFLVMSLLFTLSARSIVEETHITLPPRSIIVSMLYERGSVLSRVLVSFSTWAELVWWYPLEVTNTVNRVRSLDQVRVKCHI